MAGDGSSFRDGIPGTRLIPTMRGNRHPPSRPKTRDDRDIAPSGEICPRQMEPRVNRHPSSGKDHSPSA